MCLATGSLSLSTLVLRTRVWEGKEPWTSTEASLVIFATTRQPGSGAVICTAGTAIRKENHRIRPSRSLKKGLKTSFLKDLPTVDDGWSYEPLLRWRMKAVRSLLSATVLGAMLVMGCTSTKAVVEPEQETVTPSPVVDPAAIQAMGPPPGYVKPENYWVREKIILTSAAEPEAPATPKSTGKKGQKSKKR
jgi:hypothetical protein